MKCQKFATDLLNHARSSNELEILLNYNLGADPRQNARTVRLDRLKLAIKLKQKEVLKPMGEGKTMLWGCFKSKATLLHSQ